MRPTIFIFFTILAVISFIFTNPSFGDRDGYLQLTDGSKIYGQIVSLEDGIYKIKSTTLGEISIPESKISSFHFQSGQGVPSPKASSSTLSQTAGNDSISQLTEQILSDEKIMGLILTLSNDPQIQEVINNPDLKKAIDTGDLNALLKSPEIQKLLNNETVKEIQDSMNKN